MKARKDETKEIVDKTNAIKILMSNLKNKLNKTGIIKKYKKEFKI